MTIPFCDDQYDGFWEGFRDIASATADIEATVEKSGRTFYDPYTGVELSIDAQGAGFLLEYDLEYFLEKHEQWNSSPTQGIFALMRYGVVTINKGGHSEWDRMMRVANQHRRHGILPEDKSDPVILKQKILKSLGIESTGDIPIMLLGDDQAKDLWTELTPIRAWEADNRRNPVYKEQQLEFII